MNHIVSLDPSGNYTEGKGTTGIATIITGSVPHVSQLSADDYSSPEAYWNAHLKILKPATEIVMEGFKLYAHKKNEQTNSQFETPQLIGVIRHWAFANGVKLHIQYASEVKTRWADEVLMKKGIIYRKEGYRFVTATDERLNNHKTDALRHLLHYVRYNRAK